MKTSGRAPFDHPPVAALVELMVLAAGSDGEFGAPERRRLEDALQSLTSLELPPGRLSQAIDEAFGLVEREGSAARLSAVAGVLRSAGERRAAIDVMVRMVVADGVIRAGERAFVLEAAAALDLSSDDVAEQMRRAELERMRNEPTGAG